MLTTDKKAPNGKLNLSYWLVSHRLLVKKIFLGLFIAFDVFLVGVNIYGLVKIFLEKPLVWQETTIRRSQPPQMLEVLETQVLSLNKNRYNLVARLKNPNAAIAVASFDYRFKSGTFVGEFRQSFILPAEEKFLVETGVESQTALNLAEIEITNIRWLRLSKIMPYQEYETFRQNRFDFEIKDKIFTPAVELRISEKIPISKSRFTIINQSAYSYYDVGLVVGLYHSGKLVGINYVKLANFLSGQSRQVDLNWLQILPAQADIQVEPEVNILDEEVYIKPI
jgi:hypothetical protein